MSRRRESKQEVSRSEAVRTRRREQSQKRISASSIMATRPVPPITSRKEWTYLGAQRTASPSTKRQFQAALSMPGIEVRMPDIRITSRAIKSRLLSGLIVLLLGTALYLAATLPEFHAAPAQVTAISVSARTRSIRCSVPPGSRSSCSKAPILKIVCASITRS